jgi:hypothetical protein
VTQKEKILRPAKIVDVDILSIGYIVKMQMLYPERSMSNGINKEVSFGFH